MRGQPTRSSNNKRRDRLIKALAPAVQNIEREQIRRAPYAISDEVPESHHNAMIDHAVELGGPPGPVIARKIASADGHTVEVLVGWERLSAFVDPDAFPRAVFVEPRGLPGRANKWGRNSHTQHSGGQRVPRLFNVFQRVSLA